MVFSYRQKCEKKTNETLQRLLEIVSVASLANKTHQGRNWLNQLHSLACYLQGHCRMSFFLSPLLNAWGDQNLKSLKLLLCQLLQFSVFYEGIDWKEIEFFLDRYFKRALKTVSLVVISWRIEIKHICLVTGRGIWFHTFFSLQELLWTDQ